MKISFNIIILLLTFLFLGCNNVGSTQSKPHWFNNYSHFNNNDYIEYIKVKLQNEVDTIDFAPIVRDFYNSRHFEPVWTKNGLQEKKVDTLLTFFENATFHGISPNYFKKEEISNLIKSLKQHSIPNNDSLYSVLYSIERYLTDNYVKYAKSMSFGATEPQKIYGIKWYYDVEKPNSEFVESVLSNIDNFSSILRKQQPTNSEYITFQERLKALIDLKNSTIDTIPNNFRDKTNTDSTLLRNIYNRFNAFGVKTPSNFNNFKDSIDKFFTEFGRCHAIPDEKIEEEAIYIINHPEDNIKKLCANLERLRWKTVNKKTDDTLYIWVNIPDYHYYVFQKDSVVLKNKICCGKTQNPENIPSRHKDGIILPYKAETPLLYSRITSLTLNPEWNIPYDIIKNEYYPKLVKSNTACINKEHIYIKDIRNGKYVIPDSINWKKVNRGNIPYRLYQTSGLYNALGQVKFVFANSESVYLHDTNNKGAFKRRRRALSHGCVRIENPLDLVEWIYKVNNFDTNYVERLHIVLGESPKTQEGEEYLEEREQKEQEYYESLSDYDKKFYRKLRPTGVSLKKRIPLFIEYFTCFVDEKGEVQYREDVYYKDENIWKQLFPELNF